MKVKQQEAKMNNVNQQKMLEFVETVKKDPNQAKKEKAVTGTWNFEEGQPQFVAQLEYPQGEAVLKAELPPFAGGWGTSPDPIQYCLYGLAACFAVTFAAVATKENIQLKTLAVTAQNWLDLRKQLGLSEEEIIKKVKLTVKAEGASREELERVLKLAEKQCPGAECVTRSIPLETELA